MRSAGLGAQQVSWDTVQPLVVQAVQAVNKEEKLRGVEQRSQDSYRRRQDSRPFSSTPFPVRTIQDEAQGPVRLPLSV